MSTVHTVRVPYAGEWLTENKSSRYRWGAKAWREATHQACIAAKLPKGITSRVSIHAIAFYVGRAPVRDTPNLAPTIKACIDGLTPLTIGMRRGKPHTKGGYGLILGDSDRYVVAETWELMPSYVAQPSVLLEITEVA